MLLNQHIESEKDMGQWWRTLSYFLGGGKPLGQVYHGSLGETSEARLADVNNSL